MWGFCSKKGYRFCRLCLAPIACLCNVCNFCMRHIPWLFFYDQWSHRPASHRPWVDHTRAAVFSFSGYFLVYIQYLPPDPTDDYCGITAWLGSAEFQCPQRGKGPNIDPNHQFFGAPAVSFRGCNCFFLQNEEYLNGGSSNTSFNRDTYEVTN